MQRDVTVREVGLRDGLQLVKTFVPAETKLAWARAVAAAGIPEVEVTSFVPAKVIAQFADATEIGKGALKIPGPLWCVLVPNRKGAEFALTAGILATVSVSLTLVPIWRDEEPGSTLGKAIGVAWILAALAYLLAPVLQRWSAVGDTTTGERVLGTLDGVDLVATREPGEALIVTERPRPGERLVLRRSRSGGPTQIV